MAACADCGGVGDQSPNPLDTCARQSLACNNPCNVSEKNTPACESLPSQIQNFTTQFFGTVVKTEVDGNIVWSLPCSLDVGLPSNPRGVDEGLACYFLRLFHDGIVGLTGATGPTGPAGADGRNPYTVTLQGFAQPPVGGSISIVTSYNPTIVTGIFVYVDGSGWYQVVNADSTGVLTLTLVKAVSTPPVTVTAGKLVIPSGYAGASIQGPTGAQGPTGPAGPGGNPYTTANGKYFTINTGGQTDYNLTNAFSRVDFTTGKPEFIAPAIGTYLIVCQVGVKIIGNSSPEIAGAKLRNITNASDVPGSSAAQIVDAATGFEFQMNSVGLATTDGLNQTIGLWAYCSSGSALAIDALTTSLVWVRVS